MYYQIFDIHNEPIGKIVANNDNDARFIASILYPHYAAIHEISHARFHYRPAIFTRIMDYITSLSPFAQAIIALIITTILFLFIEPASASASLPAVGLGLDQWLHKKTYVKNWDHMKPEERHTVTVTGPAADQINLSKVSNIEEELMYWRKANMVHAFFMEGHEDQGQEVYVSSDQLVDLHSRCARIIAECPLEDGVINNGKSLVNGEWVHNTEPGKVLTNFTLAQQLLPTQDGFFFGSTDYDEWYMSDIQETHAMLEELFRNPNWTRSDYYYSSSW